MFVFHLYSSIDILELVRRLLSVRWVYNTVQMMQMIRNTPYPPIHFLKFLRSIRIKAVTLLRTRKLQVITRVMRVFVRMRAPSERNIPPSA